MNSVKLFIKLSILLGIVLFLASCQSKYPAEEGEIVETPEQMEERIANNIEAVVLYSLENNGKINDSTQLYRPRMVAHIYQTRNHKSIWSTRGEFASQTDSFINFIRKARYVGLYPDDYHVREINFLQDYLIRDSLSHRDAVAWTKIDLLLTDAFFQILKDLKEGRMVPDSSSIIHDLQQIDTFFIKNLTQVINGRSFRNIFEEVQPSHADYLALLNVLPEFVDKMNTKNYLYVKYPNADSLVFIQNIYVRLNQSGYGNATVSVPDSAEYARVVKEYQKDHSLEVDGKAGPQVVSNLNSTDNQKFRRIAITLDRYKSRGAMPESYIEVNIPSFYLKLVSSDSVILESRVVVGKPATKTPVLKASITDMVTYPQWTIPASIIRQEILPHLKNDPGYLEKKGFSLVDAKAETVNPYSVDWSKYDKWIPWKIIQGSGDDNALGVFKFNFNNPYSVYLHDTNQRYLFKNKNRALSHGCVRVEKWHDLALYIARRDSMSLSEGARVGYNADSINTWIKNKDRKRIMVKNRLPLFIDYYTCVAKEGRIHFYEDIYKDDEALAEKYFKSRS